jgi:hypothetical protein
MLTRDYMFIGGVRQPVGYTPHVRTSPPILGTRDYAPYYHNAGFDLAYAAELVGFLTGERSFIRSAFPSWLAYYDNRRAT